MTCIVGLEHAGGVVLGADSYIGYDDGTYKVPTRTPKLARLGEVIVGASGGLRFLGIATTQLGRQRVTGDPYHWLVGSFVPELRQALTDAGVDPEQWGELVVGVGGRAFVIDSGMGVHDSVHGMIGSGDGAVAGTAALYAMGKRLSPRRRVLRALEAAAAVCSLVAPPFALLSQAA